MIRNYSARMRMVKISFTRTSILIRTDLLNFQIMFHRKVDESNYYTLLELLFSSNNNFIVMCI